MATPKKEKSGTKNASGAVASTPTLEQKPSKKSAPKTTRRGG